MITLSLATCLQLNSFTMLTASMSPRLLGSMLQWRASLGLDSRQREEEAFILLQEAD